MQSTKLPNQLVNKINFNTLFSKRPTNKGKVLVYSKEEDSYQEKQIFRNYSAYLRVPDFDPSVKKSYMFLNKEKNVPNEFIPFLEFAKKIDPRFNQMVVNWYDKDDYIELHRDCTSKMISKDSPILTVNLNESDNIYNCRSMILENVKTKEITSVPLLNNHYYMINNNNTHRHAVGKGNEKRISITFRMIK